VSWQSGSERITTSEAALGRLKDLTDQYDFERIAA